MKRQIIQLLSSTLHYQNVLVVKFVPIFTLILAILLRLPKVTNHQPIRIQENLILGRKTYFLSLDFGGIQMQSAFQFMGVQNVPALVTISGKGGIPSDADKLLTGSIKKDHPYPPQITKFVSAASRGVEFGPVVKPINFTPLIVFTFFVGSIGTLVWTLRKVIFNRIPAAILVIGFCVITTSGYTFCQIRGAPMKGRDGKYSFVLRTIVKI